MRKISFVSLFSFMEGLWGTSASPPAPRNAWRVRLCGARSAVLEPSRAKALPQPAPLSPSKPPITPLKRAAHWGLTPPAAPGFPRGLGRSDKSKRTSPKAPLCVSAHGGSQGSLV